MDRFKDKTGHCGLIRDRDCVTLYCCGMRLTGGSRSTGPACCARSDGRAREGQPIHWPDGKPSTGGSPMDAALWEAANAPPAGCHRLVRSLSTTSDG
jgi:hypothetical protein